MLLLLLGCVAPKVSSPAPQSVSSARGGAELVVRGSPSERAQAPPADLVLYYGGELGGSLETCGCPDRPRGSTARIATYLDAVQALRPDERRVLLMAGNVYEDAMGLDGAPRPEVAVMNRYVTQALDMLRVDVANIGYVDLPGALAEPTLPPWAVSANTSGLPSSRIVEVDGVRVGVVGITKYGLTLEPTPGHAIQDPYRPGVAAIEALVPHSDVQVLLSYGAGQVAADIARNTPALDVVIDADMHQGFFEPEIVGEAIWLRAPFQTRRLGELRLALPPEGGVALIVDRRIDLDPELPDQPQMAALAAQAREAIDAATVTSSGPGYVLEPGH
ncbi:MAG: hypothetical protein VX899_20065 [Myxococcota bacterium]|nr:hypothetical protein [Myxococcota bacterium]